MAVGYKNSGGYLCYTVHSASDIYPSLSVNSYLTVCRYVGHEIKCLTISKTVLHKFKSVKQPFVGCIETN